MLSRVADSLYWMSRYMERTDGILRLLKINYRSTQDQGDVSWGSVLRIFSSLSTEQISEMETNGRKVMVYMVLSRENPNSVFNVVTKSRENARGVQDNITIELWQSLNEFYHLVRQPSLETELLTEDPVSVLDKLIRQCMHFYGVTDNTMFRGTGMGFMNIGKFLERSLQSTDILNVRFSDLKYNMDHSADIMYWKYLLLSVSGYALYLKKYRSGFEARKVVDQVLFSTDFPRSVIYSLDQLERNFNKIRDELEPHGFQQIELMIGKAKSRVRYANVDDVARMGLNTYLHELNLQLLEIGRALNTHYFAYS